MNKQDAMRRIEAIEAEAAELRRMVQEDDKPMRLPRFGQDGSGFFLDCAGRKQESWGRLLCSEFERFGNCFPTQEQAKKASPLFARAHKIIQAALLADPDAGEYSPNIREYSACVCGGDWETCYGSYALLIHVHTREQAEHMAAILNAEGVK